jgi:hypothetical protein
MKNIKITTEQALRQAKGLTATDEAKTRTSNSEHPTSNIELNEGGVS